MKRILLVLVLFTFVNADAQWITYTLPYNGVANSISFYDLNNGVSCGHNTITFYEQIYRTTNSGVNWVLSSFPSTIRAIVGIQYINANLVYACGAENWPFQNKDGYKSEYPGFSNPLMKKFITEGKNVLYNQYKSAFLKSTDAGVTWSKIGSFDTLTGYINAIQFFDANTGYALIDSNPSLNTTFCKTTNGGLNWQGVKFLESGCDFDNMQFFNQSTGFVSGNYLTWKEKTAADKFDMWEGRIYKTTNGGVNWSVKQFSSQINGITFFNATTGVAISSGSAYQVLKTTDGGNNWNPVFSFSTRSMGKIKSIPSSGTAFSVGYLIDTVNLVVTKYSTLKTTDYGSTWTIKDMNPASLIYGLALIDQSNFFISGSNVNTYQAVIMKSTNGGNVLVNQTGMEQPSSFKLHQNFPNPFNPSTKISFDVSKAGFVRISVFNSLGREVSVLINENLNSGSYTTDWNASAFSSGIYFCKIVSGNFTETRKMLLLK